MYLSGLLLVLLDCNCRHRWLFLLFDDNCYLFEFYIEYVILFRFQSFFYFFQSTFAFLLSVNLFIFIFDKLYIFTKFFYLVISVLFLEKRMVFCLVLLGQEQIGSFFLGVCFFFKNFLELVIQKIFLVIQKNKTNN